MEYISLIGIILALILIVVGVMKSISLIILAPIATIIVAITGTLGIAESYEETYMSGVGGFVIDIFPLFLGGALFGKLLEKSGATDAIALKVMEKMGIKQSVTGIFIASLIMTIAGINPFVIVFTMYPMAIAFLRQHGTPRKMIPGIILGGSATAQLLPGLPQLNNVLPAQEFGVGLAAAPITGMIVFTLSLIYCLYYLNKQSRKLIAKGETFEEAEQDKDIGEIDLSSSKTLPNPFIAFIPVVIVIILLNVFKWEPYAGLFFGCLIIIFMYFRNFGNLMTVLSSGVKDSYNIILPAAIVGFGAVVTVSPGFAIITQFLEDVSFGSPLIYSFIGTSTLAAVTGSATGGLQVALDTMSNYLLGMGGNIESVSRVISISAIGFDSLPYNSAIVLTLAYCGITHREGYKYVFVTTCLVHVLGAILAVILGSIGVI